ncbi:MAG TPA: hypothetical protein VL996_14135, partial [Methylocella sp.]|nr:hypothetical protein [Methylocella sp.]
SLESASYGVLPRMKHSLARIPRMKPEFVEPEGRFRYYFDEQGWADGKASIAPRSTCRNVPCAAIEGAKG